MKTSNLLLWAALITFTLLTFYFSEYRFSGKSLAVVLMGIATIKFLGIGFQFIGLGVAHSVWKTLFVFFITLFSFLVIVFS